MSSIYGIINFNNKPVDQTEINAMEVALNHWAADDKGQWVNNSCGIGHLMLYNTPESLHEKLPLFNETKQLVITADARIDNRDELLAELYPQEVEKEKIPDSSLILKTYEQYGEDCVKHLIGDFAFAIWDANHQKLFCARDHLGIKPFFYYHDEHIFAFASEKKALLALDGLNKTINEDFLLKLTAAIATAREETVYTHIKRLGGANTISLKDQNITLSRYWDLDIYKEIKYEDPQQYVDKFLTLFEESIRCRLRSAYPVGTELSGGLDSSGITCIAAELLHAENRHLHTFSYGVNPAEAAEINIHTEEPFADEVIKFAKVDKPVKIVSSDYSHFLEEIELSLRVNDSPEYYTIWHMPIKKAAGKNAVKTLLSGFPGDELVTSYRRTYIMEYALAGNYRTFFKQAKRIWGRRAAIKMFLQIKGGKYFNFLNSFALYQETRAFKKRDKNFLSPLYFKKVKKHIKIPPVFINFKDAEKHSILNNIVAQRMEMEDRMSLIYHAETRFPMADIRLIEYVLAIPFTQKVNADVRRWLYKTAMTGKMPESIVNRADKSMLMQPFLLKELHADQPQKLAWMKNLKDNNEIPDFINTDKLIKGYFEEGTDKLLRDLGVKKIVQTILFWNKYK